MLRDEAATIFSIAQKRHLEGTMPSSVPPRRDIRWIKTGELPIERDTTPEKYNNVRVFL
jgi:hypothetical protein